LHNTPPVETGQLCSVFINQYLKIKIMFYYNNFWGMDFVWWCVWLIFLFWIFAVPYDIPFQRNRKNSPLDILKKRFAAGEIGPDDYNERKKIIEADLR
jgi:putative membrane protein